MSGSDGGLAGPSSSSNLLDIFDGAVSPISAADMLTRSLRRTPRRTTTPTRRLFPDNIDLVAPGMTPTSRNRPRRKSTIGSKTPQRGTSRVATSSTIQLPNETPTSSTIQYHSETLSHDETSGRIQSTSRLRSEQGVPSATPGNKSMLRSDSNVSRGKRKARESDDSVSLVGNQFGAWGGGREESPMELLRRLVRAPGRLNSPTEDEDDTMQSISQRLQDSARGSLKDATSDISRSSLKPGSTTPGDLTRDMLPPTSRPSSSTNHERITASRFSVANTSLAASEAGQGRRAARQSQINNVFSDLLSQDTSGNQSIGQTTGKRSDFPLPEDISGSQEDDLSLASTLQDEDGVEAALGRQSPINSSLLDDFLDTTASTKRFEDIEASIESTRSRLFNDNDESDDEANKDEIEQDDEEEQGESDVFRTRNWLAQSSDEEEREASQIGENSNNYNLEADQDAPLSEGEGGYNDESDDAMLDAELGETESSDDEEDEILDQSKALQVARLALLRKRRSKKKAKRYSSISGNLVPCLPSATIKSLFVSSIMPKTGLGSAQQNKGKIVVEKSAAEAVEDLTHHFFAQFMQSLVSQAEQKSQSSISERDILALLKSQGQVSARNSLSFLARKHLPRELSDLVTSTTAASEAASARKQRVSRLPRSLSVVEEDSRIEEEE